MTKKRNFASQFRGGYYPQETPDESTRTNDRYSPPPSSKKNQGVTLGSGSAARPGMVGKMDYKRSGRGR